MPRHPEYTAQAARTRPNYGGGRMDKKKPKPKSKPKGY